MEEHRGAVVKSAAAVITAALGVYALVTGTIWVSAILFALMFVALLTLVGAWLGDVVGWFKGWMGSRAKGTEVRKREPAPAQTSLWRSTTDGLEVPSASMSLQKSVNHPGYMRDGYDPAPSKVVLAVLVACGALGDSPATTDLVTSFLDLLGGAVVGKLMSLLTDLGCGVSWHSYWSNGRLNNQAILVRSADDQEAPIAAAILNLNDSSNKVQHFEDPKRAELIIIIEPEARGARLKPLTLGQWHGWLLQALKLPTLFANFLAEEVRVPSLDDPPAVIGVCLQGRGGLMEMIDVSEFQPSPAMRAPGSFPMYLLADRGGKPPEEAALDTLRVLCDHGLHVLGYEKQLNQIRSAAASREPPKFGMLG